jgi:hypothetical protein
MSGCRIVGDVFSGQFGDFFSDSWLPILELNPKNIANMLKANMDSFGDSK